MRGDWMLALTVILEFAVGFHRELALLAEESVWLQAGGERTTGDGQKLIGIVALESRGHVLCFLSLSYSFDIA